MAGHVPNTVFERDDGTGESTAGAESNMTIVDDPDFIAGESERIGTFGHIHSAAGIADEAQHGWAFHLPSELKQLRSEVESVGDDFGAHGGVSQYELEHAALHGRSESAANGGD